VSALFGKFRSFAHGPFGHHVVGRVICEHKKKNFFLYIYFFIEKKNDIRRCRM
jgi:hypothetical protein